MVATTNGRLAVRLADLTHAEDGLALPPQLLLVVAAEDAVGRGLAPGLELLLRVVEHLVGRARGSPRVDRHRGGIGVGGVLDVRGREAHPAVRAELLLEAGGDVAASAVDLVGEVLAAVALVEDALAVGVIDAADRDVDHRAAAWTGLDDRLRHTDGGTNLLAVRVGVEATVAHVEVEERVAVSRARRVEETDEDVPLETEWRKVERLGLLARDGGGRANDVRLVDVLGALAAGVVREPAAGLHAEEHVEREVPPADALALGRERGDLRRRDVAVGVLEELGDAVLLFREDLEAVAVAGRQVVPGPGLGGVRLATGGDDAERSEREAEADGADERARAGEHRGPSEVGRASNSKLSHGWAAWLARCGRRATSNRPWRGVGERLESVTQR